MANKMWTESEIEVLVEKWKDGLTINQIAHELGRNMAQVKTYIYRNREKLNLERRVNYFLSETIKSETISDFEKEWKGPIPCGHWLITKPWKVS